MSSKVGQDTRQYGEHQRERAQKRAERERDLRIRECVDRGNHAIVRDDYRALADLCVELRDQLGVEAWDLDTYHEVIAPSRLAWDWDAVLRFVEQPETYRAAAIANTVGERDLTTRQRHRLRGQVPATDVVRRTLRKAFKSLESIAVAQAVVPGQLSQTSDTYGLALQVGLRWQPWEYETPDKIRISNPDLHPPFTVSLGLPGNGKSTAVETLVEDAYAHGTKIIDVLDMEELENAMYDLEQQQDDLVAAREELGLPTSFDDHPEYDQPEVEILHPMCRGLCETQLPYDVDDEAFTVRPFVIPVAECDHQTLKTVLASTDDQERYIDHALSRLEDRDDWTLSDLAKEIIHTEAREDLKRRVLQAIDTLDSIGIFGSKSHEHAIDWDRIFEETDVITCFSCSLMRHEAHKLMVVAYLLNAVDTIRTPGPPSVDADELDEEDVTAYDRALMVMRELQDICPSDSKLRGGSGKESAFKNLCIDRMQTLGEKRRHIDLGILGDTQQWFQFNSRVRENVDRVLLFKLQAGAAKTIFHKFTGDEHETYAEKVFEDLDTGECCVIGPEWMDTGQPFAMPIKWAPPLSHHLDADDEAEPDGWRTRVLHKDSEEFRPSPYSIDGGEDLVEETDDDGARRDTPDGFEAFIQYCVRVVDDIDQRVAKVAVRDMYKGFAEVHDLQQPPSKQQFGQWVRAYIDEDTAPNGKTRGSNRQNAYQCLELTDTGIAFLDYWTDDEDVPEEIVAETAPECAQETEDD